ncbi:signal recognition particle subunit FFH/SRP54 (srp54) [Dongia mobilis]|uniref:Signal recognition particle protein n=1 Tax=Dongia mobilis TaxID=578943 RepID=A0A4R6WTD5_9PROT|nr:signal recognition particle protein [Dongia mobilis]TDQ82150.1 signal recognition particle subunit FFH/SRP54 (srp54) [Dongia mobilis]
MFEKLSERLNGVLDKLTKRGQLGEADVDEALREVRVALLEADVALPVVKDFVAAVRAEAVGERVVKSVTPGQMVIKIVHDELVKVLKPANDAGGVAGAGLDLNHPAPVPILMLGLQGSGKTTSTAKIARRLAEKQGKKVLMASLDTRRPAAQQQLAILGEQTGIKTLPIVPGEPPVAIAKRAMNAGRLEGYDVVMLDTAGRLAIDDELMAELAQVRDAVKPHESLLVADAMTGQDAVNTAKHFQDKIGITGIMLTRIDGDARGGAALSMRAVTGRPIKLLGTGEKLDQLEDFHADRVAGRILGMGDIVSLVEKAMEATEQEEAEKLARKMQKGQFDLNDMAQQLKQLQKMGGLGGIMGMLPGIGKMQKQLEGRMDEKVVGRTLAIINSMTPKERRLPDIIKASRKTRIARGAGVQVQDVNKLLKQHQEMARMMKQVSKLGQKGLMRHGLSALMKGGPMGGGGMGGMGGGGGFGGMR